MSHSRYEPSEAGPSTYYYYQSYFNAGRADANAQAGPSSSQMMAQRSTSPDSSHPRGPRQSTEPTVSGRSSEWVTVPSQAGPRSSDNDSYGPNPIVPILGLPSPAAAARGNAELNPSSTSPPPPSSFSPRLRTPGPRELPYPPGRSIILSPFMAPGSNRRRQKDILRDEELRGSSSSSPASSGEFVGGFKLMRGMKAAYKGVMRRPPRRDMVTYSPEGLPQYSTTDPRLQPQTLPPEEQNMYIEQDMHPSSPSVNFVDPPTRHPSAVTRQSITHTHSSPQSHEHTVRSSKYDPMYVDHTSPHLSRAGTLQLSQGQPSHHEEEEEEGDETPTAARLPGSRPPFVENFQYDGGMPPSEVGTFPPLQPPTIITTGPGPDAHYDMPQSAHLRPASSYTKMSSRSSGRSYIGSFRDLPSFLRALWNLPWFAPERVTVDWIPSTRRRQRRRPQSWYLSQEHNRYAQAQWLAGFEGHPQLGQIPPDGYVDPRLLNSTGMLSVPLAAGISPMQQQQQQYLQFQRGAGGATPPPVSEMGELASPGMYSAGSPPPHHYRAMYGGGGSGDPEDDHRMMLSPNMSQMQQQPRSRMVTVTDYPRSMSRQRTATPSLA